MLRRHYLVARAARRCGRRRSGRRCRVVRRRLRPRTSRRRRVTRTFSLRRRRSRSRSAITAVVHELSPSVVQIQNPRRARLRHRLRLERRHRHEQPRRRRRRPVHGRPPARTPTARRSSAASRRTTWPSSTSRGRSSLPRRSRTRVELDVGDFAIAIGNPLGLRSSVTEGIVSAFRQGVSEGNGVALPLMIQTSAAINPGNSGGALADLEGRVIGIPTLAATDPELGGAAPGIGFAIPSNLVKDIATQIIRFGHVVNSHRAYLGVADRRHERRRGSRPEHHGRRAGRKGGARVRRRDHVRQRSADGDGRRSDQRRLRAEARDDGRAPGRDAAGGAQDAPPDARNVPGNGC